MNNNNALFDALHSFVRRIGPAASQRGVAAAMSNRKRRRGTLVGDVVAMFKRDRSGFKFTASRYSRVNDVRRLRRSLGSISGRQWRKARKAWRAEEKAA